MSDKLVIAVALGLATGIAFIFVVSFGTILHNTPVLYATTDNPLGFDARVALVHNFTHSCIQSPCADVELLQLKIIYTKPSWLLGYVVCNDAHFFSCVRQEDFSSTSTIPSPEERAEPPTCWGAYGFGQPNWKVGSTVHIWLKVAPNIIALEGDSDQFHIDEENIRWVDLGESEIIEYNHRQIREAGACN
jgi:hypothetical protein